MLLMTDHIDYTLIVTDPTVCTLIVTDPTVCTLIVTDPTVCTLIVTDPTVCTLIVTDPTVCTLIVTDPTFLLCVFQCVSAVYSQDGSPLSMGQQLCRRKQPEVLRTLHCEQQHLNLKLFLAT